MFDLNNYAGMIFDLDGTLIDSLKVWDEIDVLFLGNRGLTVPEDYQEKILHMSFEECADYTIERFGLKETRQQVMEEWFDMAKHAYACDVKLKAGVKPFLDALKENQIKMSIATASDWQLVRPVLKNNGIFDYFDNISTLNEVNRGKGFPDIYDLAAKKMNVDPKKCVVFEDIPQGLAGARMGGYDTVGVYDENASASVEELKKMCDWFIYDFRELLPEKTVGHYPVFDFAAGLES